MTDALQPATPPLRILHVMRAPVGGLFRHVLDLAGAQSRRGHAVGIVADSTSADALTVQRLNGIAPALRLGLSLVPMSRQPGLGDLAAVRRVAKIARALDLDVLHGHGAKGGAYARLAKTWLSVRDGARVRVFYTPHGGSLHYKPHTAAGIVFMVLERIMGRMTDGLIFESAYASDAYTRLVGGGVARRIIPNGLQPEDFVVRAPADDAADFLFIGELRALKGVDVLLAALARIAATRPVWAVIVGGGPDAETFKSQAHNLGLDGSVVVFPGAMPAPEAFPRGRCLVVPSRAESFPYVVLEAGAAGKPLIATRVGGIPEIVAGTAMELIAPGSVDELVRAMEGVLADPAAADARAAALRNVVQQKFTVAAMTDAVLDFYRAPTSL